ncbi:MAG: LTA synthase family protein [Fluviicola sp.]|nr:LTA synthase family protein [Fluviicola sp.]
MQNIKHLFLQLLKLLLFWVLVFDFQRILFSIHNWDKFQDVSWGDWFLTFFYSIRLDISMGAYLCLLPLVVLIIRIIHPAKWTRILFFGVLSFELIIVAFIHAGEINAYPEWNHKLTSRVFMHLSNPDEVFRTADYGMTFWFVIYSILEFVFGWKLAKLFFKKRKLDTSQSFLVRISTSVILFAISTIGLFLLARGGWQSIPINIDSAYFSNNHVANDLSVNSTYYFGNSYLLYNRSEIDDLMPEIDPKEAKEIVAELYNYPRKHDVRILNNNRPNIVFVILESWSAGSIGCLNDQNKGATPNFDALAEEGLLFTNIYSTGHTSEIGNSSIFSGNPAIPEISISLQPEKHRKLRSLNQDFQEWGYSSHYMFSGDLKYGNIGGYFMDHGFQDVIDEDDFPNGLGRGKLNYYDEDLYKIFIERMNNTKEPFMHCAFTGSTHSPYDHPSAKNQTWKGEEKDFMNSIIYADGCINDFLEEAKKQKWFKNTLFVFVADHGHSSPGVTYPNANAFYRIPLLLWGEPLKDEYRGKKMNKVGSQADLAATLMVQMDGDASRYPWSKDLLNPQVPEFALHTIIRGYGWVTNKGAASYQMDMQEYVDQSFSDEDLDVEMKKGHAFLTEIYAAYKEL